MEIVDELVWACNRNIGGKERLNLEGIVVVMHNDYCQPCHILGGQRKYYNLYVDKFKRNYKR